MSTEADALAAIAATAGGCSRTANGYATEVGADVRRSFIFGELADDADRQTLVYTASESYGTVNAEGEGNRRKPTRLLLWRWSSTSTPTAGMDGIETADAAADIKADVRRAVLSRPASSKLSGVEVGAIRYLRKRG